LSITADESAIAARWPPHLSILMTVDIETVEETAK
jgi:hypothetical protein